MNARSVIHLSLTFLTLFRTTLHATTIDTTLSGGVVSRIGYIGDEDSNNQFWHPQATWGQTFTLPTTDSFLTSFTFFVQAFSPLDLKAYVMEWDGERASGPILFETVPFTISSSVLLPYTFTPPHLALKTGHAYVAFLSASELMDGVLSFGYLGYVGNGTYVGGALVHQNNFADTSAWTSMNWFHNTFSPTEDLAFLATTRSYVIPTPQTQGSGAPWAGDRLLGSSDPADTLEHYGCFVAATSMLLYAFGHNTDPGKLNAFLTDAIPGNSSALAFESIPASNTYGQTDGVDGVPVTFHSQSFELGLSREEIIAELNARIAMTGPVIIRVPSYNRGLANFDTHQHAVLAWGIDGDDILIRNPGSFRSGLPAGRDIDSLTLDDYIAYVNGSIEIPEFRLDSDYSFLLPVAGQRGPNRGTYTYAEPTSFNNVTLNGSGHSPIEFVITDPLGRRLGYDPVSDLFYNEIPNSEYHRLDSIVSPEGDLMPIDPSGGPIDFEIGDVVDGTYSLDVFGTGDGDWSVNFAKSDHEGFDPTAHVFSGTTSAGAHSQFSIAVPEPSTVGLILCGASMVVFRRQRDRKPTRRASRA